jgi:hypothetical protein
MADKPSDERASFGFYPQLQRNRSKQDREAAKNVPVDLARGFVAGVAGAPGDIESFLRIPYDYLRNPTMSELVTGDKTSKTYLPTSEDIEKRLPFRSETPVSKAASGLGTLGGGFYFGPGSPLKVIGALPGAIRHGAQEFAKASYAGAPRVVKPKGGNWLNRSVEDELKPLKRNTAGSGDPAQTLSEIRERFTPEAIANLPEGAGKEHVLQSIDQLEKDIALNSWIDSNLTNYVKKQMATPEDPLRKLAEQDITHFPIAEDPTFWNRQGESARSQLGGTQMAQSDLAKQWENRSDSMIGRDTAQEFQDMMRQAPGMFEKESDWIKKLPPETDLYKTRGVGRRFNPQDLGFDHVLDVLRQDVAAGRIRPEQLNKVSMEQAVRRTYEYDQEMAKQMREANFKITEGFPLHKEYPEGYKWIELAPRTIDELKGVHADYVRKDFPDLEKTDPTKFANYVEDSMKSARNIDQQKLADALTYEGKTMGHCVGGYCPDVVAGKSRIFSLRDAKGEPHVTVEVNPVNKHPIGYGMSGGKNFPDDFRYESGSIAPEQHQQIYQRAKQLFNPELASDLSSHRMDVFQKAADEVLGKPADEIVQIKGKQNAKPKEDYIPYVQDFVRGGKWSNVGDFNNTDLIASDAIKKAGWDMSGVDQKYFTKQEYDDLIRKLKGEQPPAPAEGMKRGGKVSISKNPDTMMLEINNKRIKPVRKAAGGAINADDLILEERPL